MKKYIWLKTDDTKYELPIAIADTSTELAKICGVSSVTIRSAIADVEAGRQKTSTWHRIEVDE